MILLMLKYSLEYRVSSPRIDYSSPDVLHFWTIPILARGLKSRGLMFRLKLKVEAV